VDLSKRTILVSRDSTLHQRKIVVVHMAYEQRIPGVLIDVTGRGAIVVDESAEKLARRATFRKHLRSTMRTSPTTIPARMGRARGDGQGRPAPAVHRRSNGMLGNCWMSLRMQGSNLDRQYIDHWVRELGLEPQWETVQKKSS